MSIYDLAKNDKYEEWVISINKISIGEIGLINNEGLTILLYCCKNNYTKYIDYLLTMFGELTKPEIVDKDEFTALMYSINFKNEFITNKLLIMERTWITINNYGYYQKLRTYISASFLCVLRDMKNIFEIIITNERFNINSTDKRGENILFKSISYYQFSNLQSIIFYINRILEENINIDQKTIDNKTVLSFASKLNSDILDKILKRKDLKCERNEYKIFKITDFILGMGMQRGTYGQIFPVVEVSTGKTKILKSFFNHSGAEFIKEDIIKEITFINILNKKYNCNIAVNLNGICTNNSKFYLVLEPLDMTIYEYFTIINKLPHREDYILKLVENIIKTVYGIHSMGICHNDLKSNNLMVNNGQVYSIDFGIATLLLFSPAKNSLIYISTEYIKAPDSLGETFYTVENKQIKIPRNSYSYHSDVFSIGVTLLGLILGRDNAYVYIEEENSIFINPIENGKKTNILFPLTKFEIDKINSCGEYMYFLITRMINYDATKRIQLKDLLFENKISFEGPISDVGSVKTNKIYNEIETNIRLYSTNSIRNSLNGLEYLEEIHQSYINSKITLNKLNRNIFESINWTINFIIETKSFSFDNLINCIIIMRKLLNQYPNEDLKILSSASIYFCNYVSSFFNDSIDNLITIGTIDKNIIVPIVNNLIISNPGYEPAFIHIKYIVIKMQLLNFTSKRMYEFQWYAIKMLIKFLMNFAEDEICMWDFILEVTFNFTRKKNLDISKYFIKEKENVYNLDEIENYQFSEEFTFLK